MRALYVVLEHCGSRNVQNLKALVKATNKLEALEEYTRKHNTWLENMLSWSIAEPRTLRRVIYTLMDLENSGIYVGQPSTIVGKDFPTFQNDLDETQLDLALQCMATRGFGAEVWFANPNVCFTWVEREEPSDFYYTFSPTLCP
jgi:hypothetical protein